MVKYRRLRKLSLLKRRELAALMAADGEEQRYEELMSWLEQEFAGLDPTRRAYILAEVGGLVVGFVRLWNSPHIKEWLIDGIAVDPPHRQRGIGYGLLLGALDLAVKLGATSVIVHVRKDNAAAMALYEKAGFQRETTDYLNSYGERRQGRGWQYRARLTGK
jgi:ribosomal protein S18 acetylase RimI-like enzyme